MKVPGETAQPAEKQFVMRAPELQVEATCEIIHAKDKVGGLACADDHADTADRRRPG